MLDSRDPLIALADTINWDYFLKEFAPYYSFQGRPAKPIRLMVGLLILKQLEDLSDENVVLQFKRNPYYQYFCGFDEFISAVDTFNLKKWMNNYIQLLFALVLTVLLMLLWQEKMQTSELILFIWKYTQ